MLSVQIEVLPRVHLGLLSMHDGAPRVNGGIGFAIEGPGAQIEIVEAARITVRDERLSPMAPNELTELTSSLERFRFTRRLRSGANVRISGAMATHVGMGSATAIRLGAIEALAILNGISLKRDELTAVSGRGGTSGIGIHSYFNGGLICDVGRPDDGMPFLPSSQASGRRLPSALPSLPLPGWPMLLFMPRTIPPKSQQDEIAFFRRATPLPPSASFEASYIALFEIYAPAAEHDYLAFCRGVDHMQRTAWKRAERAEYGGALASLDASLRQAGADCVGMSSLGPMLFCFANPERFTDLSQIARAMNCDVHRTMPANRGREICPSHA